MSDDGPLKSEETTPGPVLAVVLLTNSRVYVPSSRLPSTDSQFDVKQPGFADQTARICRPLLPVLASHGKDSFPGVVSFRWTSLREPANRFVRCMPTPGCDQ